VHNEVENETVAFRRAHWPQPSIDDIISAATEWCRLEWSDLSAVRITATLFALQVSRFVLLTFVSSLSFHLLVCIYSDTERWRRYPPQGKLGTHELTAPAKLPHRCCTSPSHTAPPWLACCILRTPSLPCFACRRNNRGSRGRALLAAALRLAHVRCG
jgi:hypothetical protein